MLWYVISIPTQRRFNRCATATVVPQPQYASSIVSPSLDVAFNNAFQQELGFLRRIAQSFLRNCVQRGYIIPPIIWNHSFGWIIDAPLTSVKPFPVRITVFINACEVRGYITLRIWYLELWIPKKVFGLTIIGKSYRVFSQTLSCSCRNCYITK